MLRILLILTIGMAVQATAQDFNLQVEKMNGIVYIDGVDLGKKLKMNMAWQSEAGILQIGNSYWALGSSWVNLKDTNFLLQTAVQSKISSKQSFWLPLPSSLRIFEKLLNRPIEYDSATAKIYSKPTKDLWSVNLDSKENGEVVELKLSKPFVTETFFTKPNYLLRISGLVIDSAMFSDLAKKSSMISRVIPIQNKQSVQITLVIKDNCEGVELVKKDEGKTLQVVLRKKHYEAKAQTSSSSAAQASGSKKIKTIVLDPGHGGKDPGAIGHNSLKEKEVVLSVGLKLKSKLEEKGFTVKMTRDSDEFIELAKRPKMASDWGGDLFLSLHCNAIDGKERQLRTEGFTFYILRAGGSEEDKAIARRENQAIVLESDKKGKTEISPAEWIILDNQLALYAEKSALLAGYLVESFDGGSIKKMRKGASQAGFMVLVGAYMPAVLAELGFITHPSDATYMSTEKGQNEIAENLAKAIVNFSK
ncbi:MAG: N-acetylmuramoyl-L-alanine amidase [Fibromonadaceae bacterium]|jgi:N-acetylmuramoyl-L-alanine amidase|nr:N-acetylmuramoyl-L-alanine amidase [Fibromonadaceae bacterium]